MSNKPSLLSRKLSVARSLSYSQRSSLLFDQDEEDQNTLLYAACHRNETATAATILSEYPELDKNAKRGRLGSTALFASALRGNTGIVELLLSYPAVDVNLARDDGTTPLVIAAQEGHVATCKMLLTAKNIQVNKATMNRSPLFMASYKNHVDVVRLLIVHKADSNQQESEGKLTPLMIACSKGHQEIVNALLYSDDIDINLTDSAGQTALFHSALHGHCEVLQALSVRRDIDGSICRKADSSSPLQIACMMAHSSDTIATILATRNVDVHWINDDGKTAMSISEDAQHNDVVVMLGLLGGRSTKKNGDGDLCKVCVVM